MNIDCHCGKIIAIVQSSMGESDKFCFDTTVILLPSPLEKKVTGHRTNLRYVVNSICG